MLVLVSAGTIEQVILDRAQQKKEIDAKVIQVLSAIWRLPQIWLLCVLLHL